MKNRFFYQTPIGMIAIEENGTSLTHLYFQSETPAGDAALRETALLREANRQLQEYFTGERTAFSLPFAPEGTPFQQMVWQSLCAIPYGETRSYAQIAQSVGNPRACRAVGMANHRNPLPVFVPCHRVIGANGSMVGYGGGLEIKLKLLRLESGEE